MNKKFKFRLFCIFSIVILCIGVTIKELQNDTFYMIKLGSDILKNGIDLVDHYSWVADLSYTYPHWLYDIFIYLVYHNFGYFGVYVSSIVLFIVLILTIYIINLKINKNEFMAFVVSILSILFIYGFATARAQVLSALFLLLEVFFIEMLINSGKKRYVIYLCLISLLIANIHATIWLFCFVLYLPYIGEYIIYKIINSNFINNMKKKNIKVGLKSSSKKLLIGNINNMRLIFVSFVISFLMGIFTPSRICYSYVFRIMLGDSQSYITEHAPLVILNEPLFIFFIGIVILILSFTKVKVRLRDLFMIFGLSFMCLMATRHLALFTIIGLLFISRMCIDFFKEEGDRTFDILYNLITSNNIVYIILVVVVLFTGMYKFYENSEDDYVDKESYPVDAVNYIKNNLDYSNIKIYNDYNYGSYLLFNDIPVFIDSRCDLYLSEFNGLSYSIFDDAMEIIYDYDDKFDFYGVEYVLFYNNSVFNTILSIDDNYKLIYVDEYFVLYERLDI